MPFDLDKVLGLDRLSWSDDRTVLAFEHALPLWVWLLIIAAAGVVGWWSYYRIAGPRPVRGLLAAARGLLVLLIAALLARPMLARTDELVEPDQVMLLVDRSASLTTADTVDPKTGEPVTRDTQLRAALASQQAVFGEEKLGRGDKRELHWLGFGERAFDITPPDSQGKLPPADGQATQIRTAVEQALQRAAGKPVSAIVLFSDGRTPQATGQDLVDRLERLLVPLIVVPLGADQLPLDLAITRVDNPAEAFINDRVPVTVVVEQIGGSEPVDPADIAVVLINNATEEVLDERTLEGVGLGRPVRLIGQSKTTGPLPWSVRVAYVGEPAAAGTQPAVVDPKRELVLDNNTRGVELTAVDRPVRVLYIDGYPRWEYRFLTTLLKREKSIDSSMLLLTADKDFPQEGDTPIKRMPDSAEELRPFDVIMIGDVPPAFFTAKQLALIEDHIANRGAGLVWIGGERYTPVQYAGTTLDPMLPMTRPGSVTRFDPGNGPRSLRPTRLAEALAVLELRGPRRTPEGLAQRTDEWPRELPPFEWMQDLGELKPTAELLAEGWAVQGDTPTPGTRVPLMTRMRYGAGQVLYLATDEVWRYRYGRSDYYLHQFWVPVVRMLGRHRVRAGSSGDLARLSVSSRRVEQGQAVVVEVTVEDPAVISRDLPGVRVEVRRPDDAAGPGPGVVERVLRLQPVAGGDEERSPELAAEPVRRTYSTVWRADTSGELVLAVAEPALAAWDLSATIEVAAPGDEMRLARPDHDRLATLAAQTGGKVVPLSRLDGLLAAGVVPNREARTPLDLSEALWHSPLAFGLVLTLLTFEWIVRKVIRLV